MTDRLDAVSLASVSPRRRNLLESLGLHVVVVPSGYDESAAPIDGRDPMELALAHAIRFPIEHGLVPEVRRQIGRAHV